MCPTSWFSFLQGRNGSDGDWRSYPEFLRKEMGFGNVARRCFQLDSSSSVVLTKCSMSPAMGVKHVSSSQAAWKREAGLPDSTSPTWTSKSMYRNKLPSRYPKRHRRACGDHVHERMKTGQVRSSPFFRTSICRALYKFLWLMDSSVTIIICVSLWVMLQPNT